MVRFMERDDGQATPPCLIPPILADIDVHATRLREMDLAIEEATRKLEDAKKRRNLYLVKALPEAVPPFRLPRDVIELIFEFCLPLQRNASLSSFEAPIVLTHVCQLWRDVALDMSILWRTLHVSIPPCPSISLIETCVPGVREERDMTEEQQTLLYAEIATWKRRVQGRKNLVSVWLDRVGNRKLSISIYQAQPEDHSFSGIRIRNPEVICTREAQDIVDLIRSRVASQLERLEISATPHTTASLLSLPASDVPGLQELHIAFPLSSRDSAMRARTPLLVGSLLSAKTLTSLTIPVMPNDPKILDIPVKWANLTQLDLNFGFTPSFAGDDGSRLTYEDALHLLKRCPKLVSCALTLNPPPRSSLSLFPGVGPFTRRLSHVPLLELQTLDLNLLGTIRSTDFEQVLEVPALQSLAYRTSHIHEENTNTLLAILGAWGTRLDSLTFTYNSHPTSVLRECLQLLPSVKELVCNPLSNIYNDSNSCVFDDGLLNDMTPRTGSTNEDWKYNATKLLCPLLTAFTIRLFTVEFGEAGLLDFIRARRHIKTLSGEGHIARVNEVNVRFAVDRGGPDDMISGECPLLTSLRDDPEVQLDGLKVTVSWADSKVPFEARSRRYKSYSDKVWDPLVGLHRRR